MKSTIISTKYKKQIIFITILILLLAILFLWHLNIKREVKITGVDYLDPQFIIAPSLKQEMSLWNLNKKNLINELKDNPFIDGVSIHLEGLKFIVIELYLKNLIGKTFRFEKEEYIDEKGQYLPFHFVKNNNFVPQIIMPKHINSQDINFLSQELAIFKHSYYEFFTQIKKIHLLDNKNISIFIGTESFIREYKLHHIPSVRDLIKIEILNDKYQQGSVIILNGDSVIVKD